MASILSQAAIGKEGACAHRDRQMGIRVCLAPLIPAQWAKCWTQMGEQGISGWPFAGTHHSCLPWAFLGSSVAMSEEWESKNRAELMRVHVDSGSICLASMCRAERKGAN